MSNVSEKQSHLQARLLQTLHNQSWFESLSPNIQQQYGTLPVEILQKLVETALKPLESIPQTENILEKHLETISQVYEKFRENHAKELTRLKDLSPEKAVQLGNELILQTAKRLEVDPGEKIRLLFPNYIRSQIRHLTDGGVILKRHGQQESMSQDKIQMMQDPNNKNDHATPTSLAEAAGDAFMLAYIAAITEKKLAIQTSPDRRAEDVAKVFELITSTQAQPNELLKCMRYPQNLSQEALGLLKKNKGTVPWIEPEIDAVAGHGTFENRQRNIHRLVEQVRNPNFISLLISHSQEHQEMANNPTLRLDNLGVVIVPFYQTNAPAVMRTGLFTQEGIPVPHAQINNKSIPKLAGKNLLSFFYDDKELGHVVTVTLHVQGRRKPNLDDLHKAQEILSDPILQERLGQQLHKTTIISADYSLTLKDDNQFVIEHNAWLPPRRSLK